MADNKRQSMGSKAQNQSATGSGSAHMPSQETLIKAIGARIRIMTAAPNTATIEGILYTACPVTHLVAINTSNQTPSSSTNLNQPGDYHIIPASRIQSFEVLSPATAVVDGSSSIQALETRALKAREAAAIAKLQEAEARRGKGVTREAQDIFDAFSRTMPARWDGTSIVVADAVVIDKPYRVDDCRALIARDAAALTRVRKVLEMERKKIELRNASATIGNSNQFTRQNRDRVAIPSRFDNSPAPVPRKGG